MAIKNLLVWNPDPHPNLVGYDVSVNAGPATRASSNVFLDPGSYGDQATADAIVYTVTAIIDLTKGRRVTDDELPDAATALRVSRWSLDDTKFPLCTVTGSLVTVSGIVQVRPEVRVSIEWRDTPFLKGGGGYILGDDVSFFANSLGEFSIPLIQGTQVFLHIPAAHLHGTIVVPVADTVDLKDLGLEPIDLFRNN